MSARAWIEGRVIPLQEARLPLTDPLVTSGLGVFETIRVRRGVPLHLDAHLRRLGASAAALGLTSPDPRLFAEIAACLAAADQRLRLVWTGESAYGTAEPLDLRLLYAPIRAVSAAAPDDPVLWGESKHTSRAGHRVRLRQSGSDEVLFHRKGRFTEGTWSAILGVSDGVLYSETHGVLPSISAARLRELAAGVGIGVASCGPPLDCPNLYVASSLRGLCPVIDLDGVRRDGWEPVGIRLRGLSARDDGD
jgi:branched-subunit amino acid aminotransferase/4-amino-4-deoxychorismate lyase